DITLGRVSPVPPFDATSWQFRRGSADSAERAFLRVLAHVAARLVDGPPQHRELVGPPPFVVGKRVRACRRPTHLDNCARRRGFHLDGDSTQSVGPGLTNHPEIHGTYHM